METCAGKWIIIGISILIALAGLYLAIFREIMNIRKGEKDIQSIIYDKEKGIFNFSFAIGLVLVGGGLYAAIYTEKNHIGCNPVVVSAITKDEVGRILFRMDYHPSPEELRLSQQKPLIKHRNIKKQEEGYFDEFIELPEVPENYFAYVTESVNSSELKANAVAEPWVLCFKRNTKKIREDKVIAILKAGNDKIFKQEPGDPGCVVLCDQKSANYSRPFSLFSGAMAQTIRDDSKNAGWSVPNLQTLTEKKKTGFSQIIIKSKSLNPLIKESNIFYYSVRVNDVPIYIDGLLPKYIMNPFSYEKGLNLEFGLENLGFSGKNNGYEKIEVKIDFYHEGKFIQSVPFSFDYVALRKSPPQEIVAVDGFKFQWEALFKANNENQIFVVSTPNLQEAARVKRTIDSRSYVFKDQQIVGVIRPPYKNNPNYGVCVGVILPNKQIKFTFNNKDAFEFKNYLINLKYKPNVRLLRDN